MLNDLLKIIKQLIVKDIRNDSRAFQPARDNPNILNIISSHLIGDLFSKYVRVSFEKSIFEEQSSGPDQKSFQFRNDIIQLWHLPAK
jgi:hypothetical protein